MANRQWAVYQSEYESVEDFRAAVTEELARLENLGHRMGGAFIVTPIRRELEEDERTHPQVREFVTDGWVFQHDTMPAVRRQRPQGPEPVEEDPTPDELEAALAASGDA